MKIHHRSDHDTIYAAPGAFGASEGYFVQKLDHFDNTSTATWNQVQKEEYPFVQWAKERGAVLFDLEHRFYGQSRPTADQSVENLRFLSSRQAIEDIAEFIRGMNRKHSLGNASWITFGGSYSGALSLWFRQQHPELVVGAVGSSAPVQAEVDFWKYMQVVEDSLRSYSNDCAENVRIGFAKMIELMNTEGGRKQLSDLFKLDPPFSNLSLTYNDIQNFYSTIYGNFQGAVQYSGDNAGVYASAFGIPQVCDIMNNNKTDQLTRLRNVNQYMALMSGGFYSTANSYDEMIEYLQETQFENDEYFDCNVVRKLISQNIDIWLSKIPSPFIADQPNIVERTKREVSHPLEGIRNAFKPTQDILPKKFPKWTKFKKVHMGRPPHGFVPPPDMELMDATSYETGFFTQPVDHFNSQNPNSFQQRYFKNSQWGNSSGPIFLMIGGEGPESPKWVLNENITYLTWAKKFQATVYVLEHRYYGLSYVYG
ncbi:hypothetical protein GCK32_004848 [Trichostrongylus colubriformis]|uniref:Uncharacterized protein n=1 Tax=Trichostrongylus colubriformis TaxID=6319 RepID=A0AAN8IUV9_TRICO